MEREIIIKDYNSGERLFQDLNLNNMSFQGLNFSDAVFSNCQCKSTNFSQVNLSNAKFINTKTGLSNLYIYLFIIFSLLISFIQGFLLFCFNLVILYIQSATNIFPIYFLCLSFIGIFSLAIFTPYLKRKFFLKLFNIPLLFLFFNSIFGLMSGYQTFPSLIVLTFLGGVNGLCIGFLIISLAINFTVTKLMKNNILLIVGIIVNIFIPLVIANFFSIGMIPNLIFAIYIVSLALYLANDGVKAKSKSWLYQVAVFIIAYKSTKFYEGNLTNVNFENTNLEYLDLRKAILTNTNLDDLDKTKLLLSD